MTDCPAPGPPDWRSKIIKFWFGLSPADWWNRDALLDQRVRQGFQQLWTEKRQLPAESFVDEPLTALAAVILFDQFPRNMFRGHADQYSTDQLALAIAGQALDCNLDEELQPIERNFLYMPFQHSEFLADQDRAVLLQTATGDTDFAAAAHKHRDVIAQFGRFPHRNAILGRAPRADETAAGDVTPF